jgi:hypothetical protein
MRVEPAELSSRNIDAEEVAQASHMWGGMKQLDPPQQALLDLSSIVTRIAPPAPRNNFDVAGFVLLSTAAIAFLIGGAVAAGGGRS